MIRINVIQLTIIILALIIFSCKKGTIDPTLFNHGFKGITQTVSSDPTIYDPNLVDFDDWRSDTYWDVRYPIEQCNGGVSMHLAKAERVDTVRPEPGQIPIAFHLSPAYPNPADPTTTVLFSLPYASNVYFAVINDSYKTIDLLICKTLSAGTYQVTFFDAYDGLGGRKLATGVYRCIFRATDLSGNVVFASHGDIWVKY